MKGTRVISITTEYSSTASKSDEIIVLRPGTDPAFALGVAREIIDQGLYDAAFVKGHTDLPFLVRMDTKELLRAADVIPGYQNATLQRTRVLKPGEFGDWLGGFLPGITDEFTFAPAVVTDKADGKLAHLDGLNLARAWMLEGIAQGVSLTHNRFPDPHHWADVVAGLRGAAA